MVSAEKPLSISVKTFFFFFLEITWFSAEKSLLISVKTFFFFGDHLISGGKIVRISDFGPKFTRNFGEDSRIFESLGPPPIKNPGYAYDPHVG